MNEITPIEAAADPMVQMIERVLSSPDLPVERISAVLDMRERQMAKESEQAFNIAFADAMGEMPVVPRTGQNSHTRNKYSTLDDLIKTARPVLSRHGLSLNWETGKREGKIWVKATVRHSMGWSISTEDEAAPDAGKQMNALQGGGSTATYLKRYTGFAILGLASGEEVEDDGAAASETIDADQYRELRDLAERAGVDVAVICAAVKVDSFESIPASAVPSIKRKLNKTLETKGAQ